MPIDSCIKKKKKVEKLILSNWRGIFPFRSHSYRFYFRPLLCAMQRSNKTADGGYQNRIFSRVFFPFLFVVYSVRPSTIMKPVSSANRFINTCLCILQDDNWMCDPSLVDHAGNTTLCTYSGYKWDISTAGFVERKSAGSAGCITATLS